MHMTWRPATHEPDLVDDAIARAIRATIMPHAALAGAAGDSHDGISLADGRRLRLSLRGEAVRQEQHAGRAAVVYEIEGHAVVERSSAAGPTERVGYEVRGAAVLDLKTQAFLVVEHRLTPLGNLTR